MQNNQLKLLDELGYFDIHLSSTKQRHLETSKGKLVDFVSTNYLGFEYESHLQEMGFEAAKKWGTIAGWSRMELNPKPFSDLEERIASFLGANRVHLSHTITITVASLIPGIIQKGTLFTDEKLHAVVYEACRLARDHGATIKRFKHQDLDHLEELLKDPTLPSPKMICVDGVYSISSEIAPVREMQALCEKHGAWLLIDDAHGFGILGRNRSPELPLGTDGSGVVSYAGGNYDRTFYISSFGKAFCTHGAFAVIPSEYKENVRAFSTQYLFSAPINPYTLGTINGALDLNETVGSQNRKKIFSLTRRMIEGLENQGVQCLNVEKQPIVFTKIGEFPEFIESAKKLLACGVLPGYRAFPLVPLNECGFRFAITALHTDSDIDQAVDAFRALNQKAA